MRAVLCFGRGLAEGVRGFAMGPAFCSSVLVLPAWISILERTQITFCGEPSA